MATSILRGMAAFSPFIGWTAEQIATCLREVAEPVAEGPVIVNVGEERLGYVNVGIVLPRRRLSKLASRNRKIHVARAIEAIHVTGYPHALCPKVEGDVLGSVAVRVVTASWSDIMPL